MIIAIVGCAHGELNFIYETIHKIEEEQKIKVDLLICCGDFQSVRFPEDNESMNIKKKYLKSDGDFMQYYSGERRSQILTIFTGGNHEAMTVLKQLYYGGWVAPNIYYLGASGVHNIGGLRIASVSGIYKKYDCERPYIKESPLKEHVKINAYHMRKYEVEKLKLIKEPIDLMISHDWPNNIEKAGNTKELIRKKKFFKDEIITGTLGNPLTEELLKQMQPHFWFAGHLHVKFAASYSHGNKKIETKFLALHKAQIGRDFLQFLHIEKVNDTLILKNIGMPQTNQPHENNNINIKRTSVESQTNQITNEQNLNNENVKESIIKDKNKSNKICICYDLEWLAILKANHHLIDINSSTNYNREQLVYPSKEDFNFIENKLNQIENIQINDGKFFLVHGYDNPSYKNLYQQRQCFLKRFGFEELSIYSSEEIG